MNSKRIQQKCFAVLAGIGILSPVAFAAEINLDQAVYCPAEFPQCDPETFFTVESMTTEEIDAETSEVITEDLSVLREPPSMGPAPSRPSRKPKPPVVAPSQPAPTKPVVPMDPIDEAQVVLDKIINLGKTVWKIVEAGRPVVHVTTQVATALPQGVSHWEQMEGWQVPVTKVYKTTYKNAYGMNVIQFSYRVIYTYGGSVNSKGQYLTQITVYPGDLRVMWGHTFNAEVRVPTVLNMGTREAPIGGAEIQVHWSIDTVMNHLRSSRSYFVKGNGEFHDLSNGTKLDRWF